MIDQNILKALESNITDPSYSIIIENFDVDTTFCNKDRIKINLQQINPNLEEIIDKQKNDIETLKSLLTANNIEIPLLSNITVNSVINKTLVIDSGIDVNKKDKMFISNLNTLLQKEDNGGIVKRICKGEIKNHNIYFTEKDYPNYFNKSKLRINNNNLIIKIPKKILTISIKITQGTNETTYTTENINNNEITIPIPNNYESVIYNFDIRYTVRDDITTKCIELITTPLDRVLDIEFSNTYKTLPAVIPTIDEDKKVYSSYSLSFDTNENNEYIGVKISFNKFKKSKSYGDINITIIGEKSD